MSAEGYGWWALTGWLAIAGVATAYDLWAIATKRETLSHGFWRGVRDPRARWLVIPAWLLLTLHLFTGLP